MPVESGPYVSAARARAWTANSTRKRRGAWPNTILLEVALQFPRFQDNSLHHTSARRPRPPSFFAMKGFSRMGKQPLKFTFEVYVCDVRGLPSSTGSIVVVWERGAGKASARSTSAQTELVPGSIERCAMVNGKLRTMATLYRSAKRATFDQKLTTFNLIDASTLTVIATTEFDLAEYAELDAEKPAKPVLLMPRLIRKDLPSNMQITVQMTIKSHWHQGDAVPSFREDQDAVDGGCSQGTPSAPNEALQALDASQRTANTQLLKTGSKLAEAQQLAAVAASDARQAESRIATLQFRLRTEIVESTSETLERAQALKKADEREKAYQKQLIYIKDHVERIAADNGASLSGHGGVSPLEAEVLLLRRELATAKMDTARLAGEKDELDHVARRLNKQLTELATQMQLLTGGGAAPGKKAPTPRQGKGGSHKAAAPSADDLT